MKEQGAVSTKVTNTEFGIQGIRYSKIKKAKIFLIQMCVTKCDKLRYF